MIRERIQKLENDRMAWNGIRSKSTQKSIAPWYVPGQNNRKVMHVRSAFGGEEYLKIQNCLEIADEARIRDHTGKMNGRRGNGE
jgi:hypothetical protein